MKKIILFWGIIIFCLLLTGCKKDAKTIEEITSISFNDIKTVRVSNNYDEYDLNKFINDFKDLEFQKANDSYGNTAQIKYICYDSNDNVLFTIVDIGNQDKYFIKKGEFNLSTDWKDSLYELKK